MFIIIHGENQEKSSQALHSEIVKFKKNDFQIVRISENPEQLQKELRETGLFEIKKLLIIDGIKFLKEKDFKMLRERNYPKEISVLLYSGGILSATQLKNLGKPDRILVSTYPKLLWSFLDSFYPGNAKSCLKILRDLVIHEAIELILFMLVRQLKEVYMVKSNSSSDIPSWKASKLNIVASKFTPTLLKEVVSEIAEIDYRSKSSDTDAKASLDFLILSKLG